MSVAVTLRWTSAFSAVATMVLLMLGLLGVASAQEPMRLPVDPAPLVVTTSGGEVRFSVEIADDEAERSRGLMFRRDLPQDRGMLFVFERTRPVGFWMQNTPLPLDLLFVSEAGTVEAILGGVPFSTDVIAPGDRPVRFVLELHKGTAAHLGIAVGDRMRHPVIDAVAGRN